MSKYNYQYDNQYDWVKPQKKEESVKGTLYSKNLKNSSNQNNFLNTNNNLSPNNANNLINARQRC